MKQKNRGKQRKKQSIRGDSIESSFPTTQLGGSSNSVNSESESSHTEVAGMSMAHCLDVVKGSSHVLLQLQVHFFLFPHEPLYVLHPLKVTHCHSSCICVYIWKYNHSFLRQNLPKPNRLGLEFLGGFGFRDGFTCYQCITSSASGSVGWFAASTMNFAFTSPAFSLNKYWKIYKNQQVNNLWFVLILWVKFLY